MSAGSIRGKELPVKKLDNHQTADSAKGQKHYNSLKKGKSMNRIKTTAVIAVVAVIFFAAALPVQAGLYGTWEGVGNGCCRPPDNGEIYPWQSWQGHVVFDSPSPVFIGDWHDEYGNYGTFEGRVFLYPEEDKAVARGEWTWIDPSGVSSEPIVGGKFKMIFYISGNDAGGEWGTIWPPTGKVGAMKGYKVP
jgi:hypothetical protein